MADQPQQQTIAETCRCGGSINVTASISCARDVVADWRANHPCVDRDQAERKDSQGGGAILGFASPRRHEAAGHVELDVRA